MRVNISRAYSPGYNVTGFQPFRQTNPGMNSMNSRPRKSPSSKARRKVGRVTPCAPSSANQRVQARHNGGQRTARPTSLRQEFCTFRESLPTALERDTLLTPEWIAESVVQEVERFLKARLPDDFAERLAAKAHQLYPRHKHFEQALKRPGNRGRENLLMFLRHWTAAWLKRAKSPLYKRLPRTFGNGQRLPV
jgi:hypothetical protein